MGGRSTWPLATCNQGEDRHRRLSRQRHYRRTVDKKCRQRHVPRQKGFARLRIFRIMSDGTDFDSLLIWSFADAWTWRTPVTLPARLPSPRRWRIDDCPDHGTNALESSQSHPQVRFESGACDQPSRPACSRFHRPLSVSIPRSRWSYRKLTENGCPAMPVLSPVPTAP